jgi:D-arabinose 1-dehydrogenase-like Zn-dependent alcohol dehydrogenase
VPATTTSRSLTYPDQQQPGSTHQGSCAEHVILHAADVNLVGIPEEVDHATATVLDCRFATAYRAVAGRARLQEGEWIAVIGAGGAELSAIMLARALRGRPIAVDRNPEALALAKELGAKQVLVADGRDIPQAIQKLTDGGSHIDVDAVGSSSSSSASTVRVK